MFLTKNILDTIQCYANKQKHILLDPILLDCGHTACKQCVLGIERFYCNYDNCNQLMEINDETCLKTVKSIERLIESNFNELYERIFQEYTQILNSFEGEKKQFFEKRKENLNF